MNTQNVSTGELYNVSFNLFKEIFKMYNWNISTKRLLIINRSFFYVIFLCALILFLVTIIVFSDSGSSSLSSSVDASSMLILSLKCFVQNVSEMSWEYIPIRLFWLNDFVY